MASSEMVDFEPPSKFFKFKSPGDSLTGRVEVIELAGKFGPEINFAVEGGGTTTLSCSSAALESWGHTAEVGEEWRITFVSQAEDLNGKTGAKKFRFSESRKQQEARAKRRAAGRSAGGGDLVDVSF
jgi:hypothetical protein